ncbi:MAG: hypothetical protein OEZ06_20520 [Myxococcales bacterium]|nr:hypothetical protein [Myxococcales bacterium]
MSAHDEADREELDSSFTPILRRVRREEPAVLAVAFVDLEGECVDYASALDPFEAKVAGAHVHVVMAEFVARQQKLGLRTPFFLRIRASERLLWAHRIADEYLLVVLAAPEVNEERLDRLIAETSVALRREAGLPPPSWEPSGTLKVIVREAVGWDYAPVAFEDGDRTVTVSAVLGRWIEPGGIEGDELVCFRVCVEDGHELTLVHDPGRDGWLIRP